MNENERTAVNQLKNIREVSAVKLKKIDKGSPDAKPLVYISNIKRADILLRMINELEAYRAIGTVEECRAAVEQRKDDEELKLTPIEYKLLCILAKNTGKVLTHKYITQKIWGSAWDSNVASLRVFMATLRKKLGNDSNSYIQTHIGIGYRMLKVETNIEDEMLP